MAKIFDVQVNEIKLNKGSFVKTLDEALEVQIRQAGRAWLEAVIPNIPVYSGMARGALIPVGRYLNMTIPIDPTENALKRYWNTPDHGPGTGAGLSTFRFSSDNFIYTFSFSTEVPHFLINEFNVGLGSPPLIHPTPWLALEAGELAFNEYLRTELSRKIPKIKNFITVGGRLVP